MNSTPKPVSMATPAGQSAAARRPLHLGLDVPLLLIHITLVIFGLLMVYSASWDFSYRVYDEPLYTFQRQLQWLAIGLGICILTTLFNYQYWRKVVVPAMGFAILALVAVLVIRDERFGAARTLSGGSIQPSELAKLITVLYLSVWLYNRRDQLKDLSFGLFPLGIILGIVGGFIARQPDLSAVLTIVILGGLLFFLAGGDLRQILILLGLGLGVGFLISTSDIFPTGRERMESFLAGINDPLQSSEHVRRSVEAFVKGGWFGTGIGRAQTKLTGLPFPHTDSIFAVIGEETGVLGAAGLILLYIGLLWRGLRIADRAPDGLGRLMAAGLTFWIVTEACINMAVMVGLMPFAGNALPLISSGGSSYVVTMAALGVLQNIARQSDGAALAHPVTGLAFQPASQGSIFNAFANLRRGDRRRRVSGSRRSPGGSE